MPTLLIEHPITDFPTWHGAFSRFAERRRDGGVIAERVLQPVDDPHYVFVDLEFATVDQARAFRLFLESQVWSVPSRSPALAGSPRARILDTAPVGGASDNC
ncbi:hypothetical protein [Nocardioides sp.]|uniref:hypothetical protein n=1 Tax=Nocardioides sp. TaxID=35761 RepID=UPI003D1530C7